MNILKTTQAQSIILNLKKNDKFVVFTNGCFDIIHEGHLSLLKAAKELGDFLIIGLNSDSSVKVLKGPTRPINNENTRAKNLLKYDYVDAIIIFSEITPKQLIDELHPDILVKGGDYSKDDIVGAETVISYGGEVIILPFIEGYSTTNIIEGDRGKDLTREDSFD